MTVVVLRLLLASSIFWICSSLRYPSRIVHRCSLPTRLYAGEEQGAVDREEPATELNSNSEVEIVPDGSAEESLLETSSPSNFVSYGKPSEQLGASLFAGLAALAITENIWIIAAAALLSSFAATAPGEYGGGFRNVGKETFTFLTELFLKLNQDEFSKRNTKYLFNAIDHNWELAGLGAGSAMPNNKVDTVIEAEMREVLDGMPDFLVKAAESAVAAWSPGEMIKSDGDNSTTAGYFDATQSYGPLQLNETSVEAFSSSSSLSSSATGTGTSNTFAEKQQQQQQQQPPPPPQAIPVAPAAATPTPAAAAATAVDIKLATSSTSVPTTGSSSTANAKPEEDAIADATTNPNSAAQNSAAAILYSNANAVVDTTTPSSTEAVLFNAKSEEGSLDYTDVVERNQQAIQQPTRTATISTAQANTNVLNPVSVEAGRDYDSNNKNNNNSNMDSVIDIEVSDYIDVEEVSTNTSTKAVDTSDGGMTNPAARYSVATGFRSVSNAPRRLKSVKEVYDNSFSSLYESIARAKGHANHLVHSSNHHHDSDHTGRAVTADELEKAAQEKSNQINAMRSATQAAIARVRNAEGKPAANPPPPPAAAAAAAATAPSRSGSSSSAASGNVSFSSPSQGSSTQTSAAPSIRPKKKKLVRDGNRYIYVQDTSAD